MKNSLQFSHLQKSCHFKMIPRHTTFLPLPYILLHIVIIGIGYFDGALPYWMDIGWGYVSCLKYQRSRNSHGWIVAILSCVELMVVTSAAISRRMWLAELASVGLRCDPYVPTSNQRSWEDIFWFMMQFLLYSPCILLSWNPPWMLYFEIFLHSWYFHFHP